MVFSVSIFGVSSEPVLMANSDKSEDKESLPVPRVTPIMIEVIPSPITVVEVIQILRLIK